MTTNKTREDQLTTVAAVIWGADTADAARLAERIVDALTKGKITLTFDDTPAMREALRYMATHATLFPEAGTPRAEAFEAFDEAVLQAIDVDEPGALVTPFAERDPMDSFVQSVTEAAVTYDATGEHLPCRPSECIRCKVVEALPKIAQERIAGTPRQRGR